MNPAFHSVNTCLTGDIVADATALRDQAAPRNKSHRQFVLYDMLAKCMALAERCIASPDEKADLVEAFRSQRSAGADNAGRAPRRYVETKTSPYALVCRFVFHSGPNANRNGAWRYGKALEEAAKRNLTSETLAVYLAQEGGIAKLFLNRPVETETTERRTLNLTSPIIVGKGETITLTLSHSHGPFFDVVAVSRIEAAA